MPVGRRSVFPASVHRRGQMRTDAQAVTQSDRPALIETGTDGVLLDTSMACFARSMEPRLPRGRSRLQPLRPRHDRSRTPRANRRIGYELRVEIAAGRDRAGDGGSAGVARPLAEDHGAAAGARCRETDDDLDGHGSDGRPDVPSEAGVTVSTQTRTHARPGRQAITDGLPAHRTGRPERPIRKQPERTGGMQVRLESSD